MSARRKSSNSFELAKGPLSGQIALITGATGGIGTSICRLLASLGCSLAMHYNSDQDGALELLEEFKEGAMHVFGSKFVTYKADMGNYDEVYSPQPSGCGRCGAL